MRLIFQTTYRPTRCSVRTFDLFYPRTTLNDLRDTPEADWQIRRDANLLYTLLPNTQLLVQQDHVVWIHTEPLAVDCTRLKIATLVHRSLPQNDEMEAHWQKNQRISVATLQEDFDLGEEIQSGLLAGANPSHLFGRFEGALARFNAVIEGALAESNTEARDRAHSSTRTSAET